MRSPEPPEASGAGTDWEPGVGGEALPGRPAASRSGRHSTVPRTGAGACFQIKYMRRSGSIVQYRYVQYCYVDEKSIQFS